MFLNDLSVLEKSCSTEINFLLFQISKYKLGLLKSSWYFLDCVINEKLTISFVLRQQKYITRKSDKFTFVATDAANIYVDA